MHAVPHSDGQQRRRCDDDHAGFHNVHPDNSSSKITQADSTARRSGYRVQRSQVVDPDHCLGTLATPDSLSQISSAGGSQYAVARRCWRQVRAADFGELGTGVDGSGRHQWRAVTFYVVGLASQTTDPIAAIARTLQRSRCSRRQRRGQRHGEGAAPIRFRRRNGRARSISATRRRARRAWHSVYCR